MLLFKSSFNLNSFGMLENLHSVQNISDVRMFRAHKYMLVSRSPVFETMFYGAVAEKNDVIEIPDIQPCAFQILLE